jgi:hypothetical protein
VEFKVNLANETLTNLSTNIFLTGTRDVDKMILMNLDGEDLLNACKVDQKFNKLCDDEDFWIMKINKDFPNKVGSKLSSVSYKKYYQDLYEFNKITTKMLKDHNKFFGEEEGNTGPDDNQFIFRSLINEFDLNSDLASQIYGFLLDNLSQMLTPEQKDKIMKKLKDPKFVWF